jgi:hypothetical protein
MAMNWPSRSTARTAPGRDADFGLAGRSRIAVMTTTVVAAGGG